MHYSNATSLECAFDVLLSLIAERCEIRGSLTLFLNALPVFPGSGTISSRNLIKGGREWMSNELLIKGCPFSLRDVPTLPVLGMSMGIKKY